MNCCHCLAWNSADSHRCYRCGRRHAGFAQSAPNPYPIQTATAPALDFADAERGVLVLDHPESAPKSQTAKRLVYQKHLFDPQVVQLPMPSRPTASRPRSRPGSVRKYHPAQQAFDFDSQQQQQQALGYAQATEQQEPEVQRLQDSIYCDSPVAQPIHRLMAALVDTSMILIGLALFIVTFYLCGGEVVLNGRTAVLYAGIYAVMWFFYNALHGICGSDTPGMIWTDLRLVNFDGEKPDREQRIYRMFGGVLGFLSAGLGLVWSLVDEEHLTWHDHISKTFPSPQRF